MRKPTVYGYSTGELVCIKKELFMEAVATKSAQGFFDSARELLSRARALRARRLFAQNAHSVSMRDQLHDRSGVRRSTLQGPLPELMGADSHAIGCITL